jgi:hypothetical protein
MGRQMGLVVLDAVRTPIVSGPLAQAWGRSFPQDLVPGLMSTLVERTGVNPCYLGGVAITGIDGEVSRLDSVRAHGAWQERYASSAEALANVAWCALGSERVFVIIGVQHTPEIKSLPLNPPAVKAWRDVRQAAQRSILRAQECSAHGDFDEELVPVRIPVAGGVVTVRRDEIASVGDFYRGDSTLVGAGFRRPRTASGAVALLVADELDLAGIGLPPKARVVSSRLRRAGTDDSSEDIAVLTREVLADAGIGVGQLDHVEIDESAPLSPRAWAERFGVYEDLLNPRGGALALGTLDRIAALRLCVTMLGGLVASGGEYGLQVTSENGHHHALILQKARQRGAPAAQFRAGGHS